MYVITSKSDTQTNKLGIIIGSHCFPNTIITINGQLGAGKTELTKGIAKGLGIENNVTSPSFAILNIYSGSLPLYHFDLYRLSSADEIDELGFNEYFDGVGVCVIEWPNNLPLDRKEYLEIDISGSGDDERTITLAAYGICHTGLLEDIKISMEDIK